MRIGTRGSALALVQAQFVSGWLGGAEIVVVKVSGDSDASGGDKSRWVAELEQALLAGEIDLAVHSAKDVPAVLADELELLGAPVRAGAEDALVGASSLDDLPSGARVGTSSVRRAAQLLAAREDLKLVSMRGNVDTRLRKLAHAASGGAREATAGQQGEPDARSEGQLDAIVLAGAGLYRLGREREIGTLLNIERFVPAPGQGTLALQGRSGDRATRQAVAPILDNDATACLMAERALARELGASCNTPLGAHALRDGCGCLVLRAWIGLPDGSEWVRDELMGGFYDPQELGVRVAERLRLAGGGELLERAEAMAVERA